MTQKQLSYEEKFEELAHLYGNIYELIKIQDKLGELEEGKVWVYPSDLEPIIESLTQIANRKSSEFEIDPEITLQRDK